MKRTVSIIIAVAVMIFMFVVPVSAEVETSPVFDVSLAEYTAPVEITAVSEIAEGESILKNDIEGDITITSGEYVIDLNGYTWVGRLLIEGGNVTVKDTSAAKTGKIDASQINDAIDISGGAVVSLEGITVIGAFGSGDGIFVTGSPNVTIKNCVVTAGKAGIDATSLSAVIIVENTVFADFANVVPELSKDSHGRNSAIELRNNAKVILRGANEFEVTTIICRTETHSTSFAESFMLGENVTATFETENTDLGNGSGNSYTANKITYVFEEPVDAPTNEPADEPTENPNDDVTEDNTNGSDNESDEEQNDESASDNQAASNPNTGDFVPFVIAVAAVAFVATVVKRKRAF